MIRILYFLITIIIISSHVAQAQINRIADYPKAQVDSSISTTQRKFKKNSEYRGWKFPVDALHQLTVIDHQINFLFQDTSVKVISTEGKSQYNPWQSIGAAFTPNDENLTLIGDNIVLSRNHPYEVDSLAIPYVYIRNRDSLNSENGELKVVDTLIVQFYKFENLEYGEFQDSASLPEIYMKPMDYNQQVGGSKDVSYMIKIPLTEADTTSKNDSNGYSLGYKMIALPTKFQLQADDPQDELKYTNVFGFSLSYKTMVPYNAGDTLVALNGTNIENKLNYFGSSVYVNNNIHLPQNEYVNNSWWVEGPLGYEDSLEGFGAAIPGNFYKADRYLDFGVKVYQEIIININEIENQIDIKFFPNPVSRSKPFTLVFTLPQSDMVSYGITDINGKEILSYTPIIFPKGENHRSIEISHLSAGTYFITVKIGNHIGIKKFIVTK